MVVGTDDTGEFMGVAPTQKQFAIQGITVYEIEDGRIGAHWEPFDVLTILQNLGIVQDKRISPGTFFAYWLEIAGEISTTVSVSMTE